MLVPYFLLSGSAICLAIMAMLRKYYQENVGSDLTATLWFSTLSSFAAFLIGLIFSGGFGFDYVIMLCALAYAFMCTTTSMLCLIGAKYGSVSGTILCASMGTLILPSLFSGVFDSESTLSALQIVGFLFAILAMLTGFAGQHRSGKEAGKEGKKLRWIQVAVFFTNGMALVIFKALSLFRPGFHQGAFVTEYMLLAAIASFLLLVLFSKHNKKGEKNTAQDKFLSRQAILAALAYAAVFSLRIIWRSIAHRASPWRFKPRFLSVSRLFALPCWSGLCTNRNLAIKTIFRWCLHLRVVYVLRCRCWRKEK